MTRLVVDTDVFVDYLRGWPKATEFFRKIKDTSFLFSAVTEAELLSGKECNKLEKRTSVFEVLNRGSKISVENRIAKIAGYFRRVYNIEVVSDAIIAATAFATKAKLVTRNVKDFKKIKEISVVAPY